MWPRWSGSKLPGISTVAMGENTLLPRLDRGDDARVVVALEERDPVPAVPLRTLDHPAVDGLHLATRLGNHERGRDAIEQLDPLVEAVRRVGQHEVGLDAPAEHHRVAGNDPGSIVEIERVDVVT